MSSVMIRCPVTGQAISTQIEMEAVVLRDLPVIRARTRCPACGREHIWTKREAWLAEGDAHPVPRVSSPVT
jgi:hypothetical protein